MELVERVAGSSVSEAGPPVTATPIYANFANGQTSAHDAILDFYHQVPGASRGAEAQKVLIAHVARLVLPLTMLKDLRRVIDVQITRSEDLLGRPLAVGSELQDRAREAAAAVRLSSGARSEVARRRGRPRKRKTEANRD